MPPHCDSVDGPVVTAARQALDADDVDLALPFVPEEAEDEVRATFARVQPARALGGPAREVADRFFFETVVRLHRAGEGAPYTGLKPAGMDVGPVIPIAERAIETGSATMVVNYLTRVLDEELNARMDTVRSLAVVKGRSVVDARSYVEAMLDFEVYSHHLLQAMQGSAHSGGHQHAQRDG